MRIGMMKVGKIPMFVKNTRRFKIHIVIIMPRAWSLHESATGVIERSSRYFSSAVVKEFIQIEMKKS